MSKTFNISVEELRGSSQEKLEAMAFNLLIKLKFRSSSYHKSGDVEGVILNGYRRLKSVFNLGYQKANRVLNNGLKYGYITDNGDSYIANPLRNKGDYSVKIKLGLDYKIKDIQDVLLNVLVTDKVMSVNHLAYTYNLLHGKVNSLKECKLRRKLKKELKLKYDANRGFQNIISYNTLGKQLKISKYKAIRAMKTLVGKKTIKKEYNIDVIKGKVASRDERIGYNMFEYGFMFNLIDKGVEKTAIQYANSYFVNPLVKGMFFRDRGRSAVC